MPLRPASESGEDWNTKSLASSALLPKLRPASESGEDWNCPHRSFAASRRSLRPASESGEDWNSRDVGFGGCVELLRPASESGEDWNWSDLDLDSDVPTLTIRCARLPSRARIEILDPVEKGRSLRVGPEGALGLQVECAFCFLREGNSAESISP